MNRLVEIDIVKGICIILVVVGHLCDPNHAPDWYSALKEWIYLFHMPTFMFASGLLYAVTKKVDMDYIKFVMNKAKRLMIPYVSASITLLAIKYFTIGESFPFVQSLIRCLYYPEASFAFWFIWSLMTVFLIVPFFNSKEKRLILFAISVILHFLSPIHTMVFALSKTCEFFMWFMLGVVCVDWKDVLKKMDFIPLSLLCSLCLVLWVINTQLDNMCVWGGEILILNMYPFLAIIALVKIAKEISKTSSARLFLKLSYSSFVIYLFHTTFTNLARVAISLVANLDSNNTNWTIGYLIVLVIAVIGPYVVDIYLIRKYKITRFLFGYKK